MVIKKCTMREGNLEYSNFSFDLGDLLTHLEIFSQIRTLESIKLENIYATGPYTGDMETIDWYFKEILKTIQRKFHNGLKLRIPIESYGYSYAEIFKEENE